MWYELRLFGKVIEVSKDFETIENIYNKKKANNPSGLYEIYKVF